MSGGGCTVSGGRGSCLRRNDGRGWERRRGWDAGAVREPPLHRAGLGEKARASAGRFDRLTMSGRGGTMSGGGGTMSGERDYERRVVHYE